MSHDLRPFEGRIALLSYTETDWFSEGHAVLVYRVVKGKLQPLYGVLNLPDGVDWNYHHEQYKKVLEIIQETGEKEVFTPWITLQDADFFGTTLGTFALSEELDADGALECWFEFGALVDLDFIEALEQLQITIRCIDVTTMKILETE